MIQIFSHYDIDEDQLNRKNKLKLDNNEFVEYTVNYNNELVVNMPFVGNSNSSNAFGWKRDSKYYFRELFKKYPECFSSENIWKIEDGHNPICDSLFIEYFPEYEDFLGEDLIHHHVGRDGQAVALPQGLHIGCGIVHVVEKELKITENGILFSKEVRKIYEFDGIFNWEKADEVMKAVVEERYKSVESNSKTATISNKVNDFVPNENELNKDVYNLETISNTKVKKRKLRLPEKLKDYFEKLAKEKGYESFAEMSISMGIQLVKIGAENLGKNLGENSTHNHENEEKYIEILIDDKIIQQSKEEYYIEIDRDQSDVIRQSPASHTVKGHSRRVHTKNGIENRVIKTYDRGCEVDKSTN